MTAPSSHASDDPAVPSSGWLVGADPARTPTAPSGAEQRSARLTARLDAYARYAALVAEEAAAVLRGDAARAEALAGERSALADHWTELRAAAGLGGADDQASFGDLFADALREADHQSAVDLALRHQLSRVADGLRALPAPAEEAGEGAAESPATQSPATESPTAGSTVAGVVAALAGSLVEARSRGLDAALSGYFPGATGGVSVAAELAAVYGPDAGAGGETGGQRLDVRF